MNTWRCANCDAKILGEVQRRRHAMVTGHAFFVTTGDKPGPPKRSRRWKTPSPRIRKRFRDNVTKTDRCAICGSHGAGVILDAHHLIPLSFMRREGAKVSVQFDPRNGLCVCRACHGLITSRAILVPVELVPPWTWTFADEHGWRDRLLAELRRR